MNRFASVLAAIALAATSGASSAVEETTDKRNAHRTQASKHLMDAAKTYSREVKAHPVQEQDETRNAEVIPKKDRK
jgi:hypothetical protein